MSRNNDLIPSDYPAWLEALKGQITAARSRAALAVNAELIHLYHRIGQEILDRQAHHGWGSKVIPRIADDLKAAFPDMKGFSRSNVKYMRYFAEHCPDGHFGQQSADQLPWFHIVTLLTKAEPAQREWYAKPTIGLLLCRSKNSVVAQYAVNGINKPIGIAEFDLLRNLPMPLADNLPSIEEIEAEFSGDLLDDPKGQS